MKSHRGKQLGHDLDPLSLGFDRASSSLVTLAGGYAPNYTGLVNDKPSTTIAASKMTVTAAMADPNVTPPAGDTGTMHLAAYSVIVFHVVFSAGGSGNVEVWVDGGQDSAGAEIGWLLLYTYSSIVTRKEHTIATGQRPVYLRLTGTAGVDVANPAILRAAGVA